VFNTLAEAKVLIEQWRRHYNTVRPHSSLHYRPPAEKTVDFGSFGLVGRSAKDPRAFHLAIVFGFTP
jgi:hypothetical protein